MHKGNFMRASILITLEDGTVLEGITDLKPSSTRRQLMLPAYRGEQQNGKEGGPKILGETDFRLGPRPFMKKNAGGLSGHERLILLVAHFAKGKVHDPVSRRDVVRQWDRMKPIMGGKYNGAYDTRARETGWLDSPKAGVFELCPGWEAILK